MPFELRCHRIAQRLDDLDPALADVVEDLTCVDLRVDLGLATGRDKARIEGAELNSEALADLLRAE